MLSLMLLKLTFNDVVSDIPHDLSALVVYLMLGLFIGFIWYGSRGTPQEPTGDREHGSRQDT